MDRLFRVEGIETQWSERQVRLTLLDMGHLDEMQPWVLDDEKNWLRHGDDGSADAEITTGDTKISFSGYEPKPAGVEVGDVFWLNDGLGRRFASVVTVTEVDHIEVEDAPAFSGSFNGCWEIQRGYATAPDNNTHPGEYIGLDSANDLYGSLCDESLVAADGKLGAMAFGGAPGYELYGE